MESNYPREPEQVAKTPGWGAVIATVIFAFGITALLEAISNFSIRFLLKQFDEQTSITQNSPNALLVVSSSIFALVIGFIPSRFCYVLLGRKRAAKAYLAMYLFFCSFAIASQITAITTFHNYLPLLQVAVGACGVIVGGKLISFKSRTEKAHLV